MLSFNNGVNERIDQDQKAKRQRRDMETIFNNPGGERIQETDFKDIYPPREIESDLKMVERLQDKFASQLEQFSGEELKKIHEGEQRSEILEIIIATDGEKYHWTGEKTRLSRAARFDDIANGIDIILEFELESFEKASSEIDRIALGIDTSRNSDIYALQRKIARNIEKLTGQNGKKLPQAKYFQSAIDKNIKGELNTIIPIVIGLDFNHVNGLIHLCAASRSLADPKHNQELQEMGIDPHRKQEELKEQLLKHPAQVVFYRQIITQLNYYLKVLDKQEGEQTENIKVEINSILKRVRKIKETKKNIPIANYDQDAVLKTIEEICS